MQARRATLRSFSILRDYVREMGASHDGSDSNKYHFCYCCRDLPPSDAHRAHRMPSLRSAARRACMRAPCHRKQMRGLDAALLLLRGLRHCGEDLAQRMQGLRVPGGVAYV